jgi:hypothetical protein
MKKFLGILTKCKDELYVYEFCKYYISQGVDKIYILDDNSFDKSIYDSVKHSEKITIIYTKNCKSEHAYSMWYKKMKNEFEWMMNVDIDEFITTKKFKNNTIRDELLTTFKDADCIKIPWVFMSFNSLESNPLSILTSNTFRWDHDKTHQHHKTKFRCRYNKIEVKCIFRTDKFDECFHHIPKLAMCNEVGNIVNSIDGASSVLSPFHNNLRECDIENGILLCYHYRINSVEHALNKLAHNHYYHQYTLEDLIAFNHPEKIDHTLDEKYNAILQCPL